MYTIIFTERKKERNDNMYTEQQNFFIENISE